MHGEREDFAALLREELPPRERIEHDLKGHVRRSRVNDVKPLQTGARRRMPGFREEREQVRARLESIGRELTRIFEEARKPDTAANAELSVRASWRLADAIARRARELKQVREPEPYMTHPTRERVAQAGEPPRKDVLYAADGQPDAVSHRWTSPVVRAHRLHILRANQYYAAARLRRAFLDKAHMPKTMDWERDRPPSDPMRRNPITAADMARQDLAVEGGDAPVLAGREFRYVWSRLEDELKAVVWVLVFGMPLPGEAEPLSPVEFGKRIGQTASDDLARWFSYGALKITLVRLASIYQHWDVKISEEQRRKLPPTQERRTA